jgi:hypothetical protein
LRALLAAALLLAACAPPADTADTAPDTGDTADFAPPDATRPPAPLPPAPRPAPARAHRPSLVSRLAAALLPRERPLGEGPSLAGAVAVHDASDLRRLRGVVRIEGALRVRETSLPDLSGLEDLQRVGDLEIIGNPHLADLSALRHLRQVDGALHLDHNPALEDLFGLDQLERVGVEVAILNNEALVDISALRSLRSIGLDRGWCGFGDAPALAIFHNGLADLAGLDGLREINGPANLHDNGAIPAAAQAAVAASLPSRPCFVAEEPLIPPPPLRAELPPPPPAWDPAGGTVGWDDGEP